jgi:hypothetical protein
MGISRRAVRPFARSIFNTHGCEGQCVDGATLPRGHAPVGSEALSLARRRPARVRARRNRANPSKYQGRPMIADKAFVEVRSSAKADHHRQASISRCRQSGGHAESRASPTQRLEQPAGEFACTRAKAGAGDATVSVMARVTTLRLNFLRRPQSLCAAELRQLRSLHAPSSPEGDGGIEIRHRQLGLKRSSRPKYANDS